MINAKKLLKKYREQTRKPYNRLPRYARITAYAWVSRTAEEHINALRKYNHYWRKRNG